MNKTMTPEVTPSPSFAVSKAANRTQSFRSDKSLFVVAVLNLSWQMAIVVLVPILGGYALDKKFHSLPLITIAGFVVATLGVVAVLWRQLQQFGPPPQQRQVPKGGRHT